jgi:PAS domain S-box-containing protein
MRDSKKTKEHLLHELAEMCQHIAELESLRADRNRAEETLQRAYDELELRIAARTVELVQANQQLKQEIEERKRTETELKRIKEYLENVIDNSVDAIGIVDRHGKFILWNRRAAEIYGYQLEELADKTAFELYADPVELDHMLRRLRRDGVVREYEIPMKKKDGTIVPMDISISLLKDDRSRTIGSVCVARDLSERQKAAAALKSAQEELSRYSRDLERQVRERTSQLRRLSASIMANQEKERTAIARELHDELGQVLTALRMDAVWLGERLRQPDPKASDRALAMCRLIDNTIDEVRGLATRLRPGVLDDLGLIDALEWYIMDFEKRTGIACVFKHGRVPNIDGIGATAAYRIVQEALTNVTRHAGATQVKVSLQPGKGMLTLAVVDNGRGFNLQEIAASECLGLAGMRERAGLLGGSLEIRSRPGKGTKVCFRLPADGHRSE